MRAARTLRLLLVAPVVGILCIAALVYFLALNLLRNENQAAHLAQQQDLSVIAKAASFGRDIGLVQQGMYRALHGAMAGELNELQLYRMHSGIVEALAVLGVAVRELAASELVIDANHDSAKGLAEAFNEYRRFVIMATDVLAVDPAIAANFLDDAEQHFLSFSVYSNRITLLLAERAEYRSGEQTQALAKAMTVALWVGLSTLGLLLLIIYAVTRQARHKLLVIADALTELAERDSTQVSLPRVDAIYRQAPRGEFGRIAWTLLRFRDALERQREAEERAYHLATHDLLTDLPNHRVLRERIAKAPALCRTMERQAAIIVLDLDDFKSINDTLGHAHGDQLLIQLARRVGDCPLCANGVMRLGADTFAVLLESVPLDPDQATRMVTEVAESLQRVISKPFRVALHDDPIRLSVSMGIAFFGAETTDADEPLQRAEVAMFQAKRDGRGGFRLHDPFMQERLQARVDLERDLWKALERDEFRLFYQVQVDETGACIGAEALLRWQHPKRGLLGPDAFIEVAEVSGLIVPIGEWVLKTGCRQLKEWEAMLEGSAMTLAINVSARQFRHPDFVMVVQHTLEQCGVLPQRLKLELTESTVLEDVVGTNGKMHQLRSLGIHFSIDDFGTGYSSLSYLKQLPFDQLKIDQSFVRDISDDEDDAAIVQAMIALSTALGMDVIAEGVETERQREALIARGCRRFQGYLFGRPVPVLELQRQVQQSLSCRLQHGKEKQAVA